MVISISAGLCRPFAYNWNKSIPGGECGNLNSAYIAIAALDIIGDAMIVGEFGPRFEFFCLCSGEILGSYVRSATHGSDLEAQDLDEHQDRSHRRVCTGHNVPMNSDLNGVVVRIICAGEKLSLVGTSSSQSFA